MPQLTPTLPTAQPPAKTGQSGTSAPPAQTKSQPDPAAQARAEAARWMALSPEDAASKATWGRGSFKAYVAALQTEVGLADQARLMAVADLTRAERRADDLYGVAKRAIEQPGPGFAAARAAYLDALIKADGALAAYRAVDRQEEKKIAAADAAVDHVFSAQSPAAASLRPRVTPLAQAAQAARAQVSALEAKIAALTPRPVVVASNDDRSGARAQLAESKRQLSVQEDNLTMLTASQTSLELKGHLGAVDMALLTSIRLQLIDTRSAIEKARASVNAAQAAVNAPPATRTVVKAPSDKDKEELARLQRELAPARTKAAAAEAAYAAMDAKLQAAMAPPSQNDPRVVAAKTRAEAAREQSYKVTSGPGQALDRANAEVKRLRVAYLEQGGQPQLAAYQAAEQAVAAARAKVDQTSNRRNEALIRLARLPRTDVSFATEHVAFFGFDMDAYAGKVLEALQASAPKPLPDPPTKPTLSLPADPAFKKQVKPSDNTDGGHAEQG